MKPGPSAWVHMAGHALFRVLGLQSPTKGETDNREPKTDLDAETRAQVVSGKPTLR